MSGQKQHVELHRKIGLRRALLSSALEGCVYVPFIGDGDISDLLYRNRKLYGADIDPERVATAKGRFPDQDVRQADCDMWPFAGNAETFAVADFDSYAYPYSSFRSFWQNAEKADRLVMFFTDGERQGIKRSGAYTHPSGVKTDVQDIIERRKAYNFYLAKIIEPWFTEYIKPWKVLQTRFYLRKDMLYWGAVIERCTESSNVEQKPEEGQLSAVEEALYLAATSGNVRAIEMWLERQGRQGSGKEPPLYRKDGTWE